jgi:aryl-alcohol dehydrogenase-like predicted oxidoreductase
MSGAALAIRFVLSHQLVASAVFGATGEAQLRELAEAARQPPLEPELAAAVEAIHQRYPNPTP